MVQLDPDRAAEIADLDVGVKPAVTHPQIVQVAERGTGEEAKLGMVALGLELGDHDQREHDSVLSEPAEGAWVGEQDAGV